MAIYYHFPAPPTTTLPHLLLPLSRTTYCEFPASPLRNGHAMDRDLTQAICPSVDADAEDLT